MIRLRRFQFCIRQCLVQADIVVEERVGRAFDQQAPAECVLYVWPQRVLLGVCRAVGI